MPTFTLYLQNAAPSYTPASKRGAWDDTTTTVVKGLGVKAGDSGVKTSAAIPATANWDTLITRFVSAPLAGGIYFAGSIGGVVGIQRYPSIENAKLHIHVFVLVGQTDVLRGTLLADYIDPDVISNTQSVAGQSFGSTMANLQAFAGDTIVVEIGVRTNAVTPTYKCYSYYGTTHSTNLQQSGNPTVYPGWIQFTTQNQPPNAPTLVSPIGGMTIVQEVAQTFSWVFSDPDGADIQSAYNLRYRQVGTSEWTTTQVSSSASQRVFAAATFVDGYDYEWQTKTADTPGVWGPYSTSGLFTAVTTPNVPSITDPANGATITDPSREVTWSTPEQDAYQVRTVADDEGVPDPETVYTDTGTVESAAARSVDVAFATNNRYEHVQVRVRYETLWSSWGSVRVYVAWTAPATPIASVIESEAGGYIAISATHPDPEGNQPNVAWMDIHRSEAGAAAIRIAKQLAPTAVYQDWAVASGVEYAYFVRAVGTTGATADSELVS